MVGSEKIDAGKCECGKFVVVWGAGVRQIFFAFSELFLSFEIDFGY
jgi:hypothetical protein